MKVSFTTACIGGLLLLTACSEAPKKTAEPEKPPEPVTGRYSLYQMYPRARAWATDVQPLNCTNINLPEAAKSEPGKSLAWQCVFVSASLGRARRFTYSVIESPGNVYKGVFQSTEERWSGQQKPFLLAALKTDSDEVFATALKRGAAYAKKHPDMPVNFLLEVNNRFPNPTWRVIWGDSITVSGFSIYVDASSGEYLQTAH
ncbi:MAG: hypothetical protein WD696_23070 [Bryobacteraceae bacterium]